MAQSLSSTRSRTTQPMGSRTKPSGITTARDSDGGSDIDMRDDSSDDEDNDNGDDDGGKTSSGQY